MIITKEHIFAHIPKTAGRSLWQTYAAEKGTGDLTSTTNLITGERLRSSHLRLSEVRDMVGNEIYDNALKFAIVRNPLDRLVSFYHYGQIKLGKQFNSFEEFVDYATGNIEKDLSGGWLEAKNSLLYYLDDEVDYVLRFESISDDWDSFKDKIGVESKIIHVNKSKHTHYLDYYNESLIEKVKVAFSEDFERFKYV